MDTLILGGNGSVLNRGCQAIEHSTLGILRRTFRDMRFIIAPMGLDPSDVITDADCVRVERGIWGSKRWSPAWLAKNVAVRLAPRAASARLFDFSVLDTYMPQTRGLLQLGGDNFSLDYGGAEPFFGLNRYALAHDVPVVLWGASVGPFTAEPAYETHALRELSKASLILAREQITADYLTRLGVRARVERVADPAFTLEAVRPDTSVIESASLRGAIGINVSPLYERYTGTLGGWVKRVSDVVEAVQRSSERPVVLVPHVMVPGESDHDLLVQVAEMLERRGLGRPMVLPPDMTAAEIKWCISQFHVFIAARTHAAIAALSTGVPTLSLAYSIKARGINMDVMGDERFIVPATEFNPSMVSSRLAALVAERDQVADHLRANLPRVVNLAESAGELVRDVLWPCTV